MKCCVTTRSSRLLIAILLSLTTIMVEKSNAGLVDGLTIYYSFDAGFADEAEGLAGSASTVDDELRLTDDNALTNGALTFTENSMFGLAVEMGGAVGDGHLYTADTTLGGTTSVDVVGATGAGGYLDGNMSLSVWAQASAFTGSWQAIAAHGEGPGYRLHRRGAESTAAFTGNGSGDTATGNIDISPGTGWHHYVATVTNNVAELYVDGVFQGSAAEGTPADQGFGLHIGANPGSADYREWVGQIDDFGLYNRALTSSEAFEIYSKGLTGCSLLDPCSGGDPFIPFSIPGPAGSDGQWGVREITGNGTIDSIQAAATSATSGGTITEGRFMTLDVTDPDTNPNGGPTLSTAPHSFLTNTASDDDNITTVAKGTINVVNGGDYTFQVNADNGFGLRIVGQEFASAAKGGVVDPNDPTTFARLNAGGGLGVVNLAPGEYDVEFLSWEGTGGGFYEVTSAQGVITEPKNAQWIAVGDPTSLPGFSKLPTVVMTEADVFNMGGVPVAPSMPGGNDGGVEGVRAMFAAGVFTGTTSTSAIALFDPDTNAGNALGGVAVPFPSGVAGTGDDNFSTAVFGEFVVDDGDAIADEDITLTFSVQSDDNGSFHVIGSSFETSNQPFITVNGDQTCAGDFNSGNVNTTCTITLKEGNHEFAGYHREEGGGAFYQVWWAEGALSGFNASEFSVLSTDETPTDIPANQGLALVGGGGGLDCDFDLNGACNVADINSLMTAIAAGTNDTTYDLTGDGVLNDDDRNAWLAEAGPANGFTGPLLAGDANLDGRVDAADLNKVGIAWQSSNALWSEGNFTGANTDAADLNVLGINWQRTVPLAAAAANAAPAAVPEPSSVLLLLGGLFVLSLRRRK